MNNRLTVNGVLNVVSSQLGAIAIPFEKWDSQAGVALIPTEEDRLRSILDAIKWLQMSREKAIADLGKAVIKLTKVATEENQARGEVLALLKLIELKKEEVE